MTSGARVVAITTVRSEPDWLVEGLVRNLSPWCADVLVHRVPTTGPWGHEGKQLADKRRMLIQAGATWALFVDPDERIEDRAAEVLPAILEHDYRSSDRDGPRTVYGFPLKEMWTPEAYRIDGTWGDKLPRHRLFWLRHNARWPDKPIHCSPAPRGSKPHRVRLPVNLYHLKNIEPSNRIERARAYMDADPDFAHQRPESAARNWDWMSDETGLELESIPEGRGFTPPYTRAYEFRAPE